MLRDFLWIWDIHKLLGEDGTPEMKFAPSKAPMAGEQQTSFRTGANNYCLPRPPSRLSLAIEIDVVYLAPANEQPETRLEPGRLNGSSSLI